MRRAPRAASPSATAKAAYPLSVPVADVSSIRNGDVNPKKNGQGRDAERIVTGNDGSAWYTLDHYDTFVRIR